MIYNVKKRKLRKEVLPEKDTNKLKTIEVKSSQLSMINLDLLEKLTRYEFNQEEKSNEDNTYL